MGLGIDAEHESKKYSRAFPKGFLECFQPAMGEVLFLMPPCLFTKDYFVNAVEKKNTLEEKKKKNLQDVCGFGKLIYCNLFTAPFLCRVSLTGFRNQWAWVRAYSFNGGALVLIHEAQALGLQTPSSREVWFAAGRLAGATATATASAKEKPETGAK